MPRRRIADGARARSNEQRNTEQKDPARAHDAPANRRGYSSM
jgi:hypothetical protein